MNAASSPSGQVSTDDGMSLVDDRRLEDCSNVTKNARLSRPPLERMQRLHEMLSAGRYPNCRRMAAKLEVSTKTIQRDLDFMRDRLQLPIEYDGTLYGYRYSRAVVQVPITLTVVKQESKQVRGAVVLTPPCLKPGQTDHTTAKERNIIEVRIRFDTKVAADVKLLKSLPYQESRALADGSIELTFRMDSVAGLDRWVLSWGASAHVLEPIWFRRRILNIARTILNTYREH